SGLSRYCLFFQAEDGIRDFHVTGVQTCALPIYSAALTWDHRRIYQHIEQHFPTIADMATPRHATARRYKVPGHKGDIGIIAAYTRLFCGSCNRIRVTPTGMVQACLYDRGTFNIKDTMRD